MPSGTRLTTATRATTTNATYMTATYTSLFGVVKPLGWICFTEAHPPARRVLHSTEDMGALSCYLCVQAWLLPLLLLLLQLYLPVRYLNCP